MDSSRRQVLAVLLALPAVIMACGRKPHGLVAYSFHEAGLRIKAAGAPSPDVLQLGGLTRLVGMVYDARRGDSILIGDVVPGEPTMSLDDAVVALRSLYVFRAWPLVSIDRTPETARTGKQVVRFEGGIEHSAVGAAFLTADVTLKRLALGLLPTNAWGFPSYFALSVESAKAPAALDDAVTARFWFRPIGVSLEARDGVVVIRDLRIGVQAQLMSVNGRTVDGASGARDPLAERFARDLETHHADVGSAHPEIRRLGSLFQLVALARGIETLPSPPNLSYWLHEYRVPRVETPVEYPVLRRQETVTRPDGPRVIVLNGGIELHALALRLEDGDVTALRDAVLLSRPSEHALTWTLPLRDWSIAGATRAAGRDPARRSAELRRALASRTSMGAFITRQVIVPESTTLRALPSQRFPALPGVPDSKWGGVDADVKIDPEDIVSK